MLGKFQNVLPEMVSIRQYRKDQNNGIVKEKYISETFKFGDIPWQKFKSIDHLDFVISYNEKYRSITHHRIMKSIKMANIVLQRMWTNMSVSARLALPLFDKQITTIVLYGCPVWSLPDSQPACMNIKKPCIWRYCWQAWHLPMLAKVQTDAFLFDFMFMVTK